MKKSNRIYERYHKSYHFLHKAGEDPFLCLSAIFDTFRPNDLRNEIIFWQQLALANDQSAYDEGKVREELMDFCRALLRVTEALYMLEQNKKRKGKAGKKKRAGKAAGEINNISGQITGLSMREKDDPQRVVRAFCKAFPYDYARIELLDLLDAVITYEGKKEVYKGNLVPVYQCIGSLVHLAYVITKHKKTLHAQAGAGQQGDQ
ncbi:MAG TPA: hypothetical protein PLL71_16010 [Agriterribacter sp.]|nr:hypothetical protein [Agriterribacter sp.]HRQ51132.1 hypothetical protein [Agriterribacter sp.]